MLLCSCPPHVGFACGLVPVHACLLAQHLPSLFLTLPHILLVSSVTAGLPVSFSAPASLCKPSADCAVPHAFVCSSGSSCVCECPSVVLLWCSPTFICTRTSPTARCFPNSRSRFVLCFVQHRDGESAVPHWRQRQLCAPRQQPGSFCICPRFPSANDVCASVSVLGLSPARGVVVHSLFAVLFC
jgi:hypothetical protein